MKEALPVYTHQEKDEVDYTLDNQLSTVRISTLIVFGFKCWIAWVVISLFFSVIFLCLLLIFGTQFWNLIQPYLEQ
ncbi:hypothetical protein SAMN02745116_02032 [Pilibacter termitis]|jgi:hypothetical protein|uniref:Uncharacterized protein n=1 Tax=Pilibacter termitis TaxID=263852 RepID=A0A1T4Q233_9ENTE|nr:hypothetical protein [Pilibacter termitis]SJZ97843.1 hypothetical protein SAMN02745116_02032 [Pilibacter termitis]